MKARYAVMTLAVLAAGQAGAQQASSTASVPAAAAPLPRVALEGESVVLSSSSGPRYATLRELGKGGMGEVDLVEDRDIGFGGENADATLADRCGLADHLDVVGGAEQVTQTSTHQLVVVDEKDANARRVRRGRNRCRGI